MAAKTVEGVIHKHPNGFGFLDTGRKTDEDVYLAREELTDVMDGDRLKVEVVRRRGRTAGRLLEVLGRGRRLLLGTYQVRRGKAFVVPKDEGLSRVDVTLACDRKPKDGDLVKVRLLVWPSGNHYAEGEVVEVLGGPGDPMYEVLAVAFAKGFADDFPEDVMAEAATVPSHVGISDAAGRRDLRGLPLVTIDGKDARDFDDAVFAERIPGGGYRLVVAIADVAHYVRAGMPLDREAVARSTSVYMPNLVLPMLPEKLSNGICSLVPDDDRLCMVADMTLTEDAKTVNTEIYEAVMRSHARLTYDEVASMMGEGDEPVPAAHAFWHEKHLEVAVTLSKKLNARRRERGSIDLDLPEPYVVLDETHRPAEIRKRARKWAHRLIEEFMLAANEAVAYFFDVHGLPTIYRVHDEPDTDKLGTFAAMARAHGFALSIGDDVNPKVLGDFLKGLEGNPAERALSHLLLRSMQQALYSPDNIGHFGLGATHYLHFTSPIRRYPDLMVHRLLKRHFARAGRVLRGAEREKLERDLDAVALQASQRERAAMAAEREVDDYFGCLYMEDKVGETFEAAVTGVTDFGLFVELTEHFVQGLVKAEHLGDGWQLDEKTLRLVFGDGRSFTMGDRLEVVCASVNVSRRQIDFEPAVRFEGRGAARPAGAGAGAGKLKDWVAEELSRRGKRGGGGQKAGSRKGGGGGTRSGGGGGTRSGGGGGQKARGGRGGKKKSRR